MAVSLYKLCDRRACPRPCCLHNLACSHMCPHPPFLSLPTFSVPHAAGAYMLVGLNKINENQTHGHSEPNLSEAKRSLYLKFRISLRGRARSEIYPPGKTHNRKVHITAVLQSAQPFPAAGQLKEHMQPKHSEGL